MPAPQHIQIIEWRSKNLRQTTFQNDQEFKEFAKTTNLSWSLQWNCTVDQPKP